MAFVSTPSPGSPASINTPPTPRLGGFDDDWEPYTPVRKSARISSQQRTSANRTPSPHLSGRTSTSRQVRTSPKSASDKKHQSSQATSSSMTSPPATASPQKKRLPASSRVSSGSLTAESIRNAAAALGQSQRMDSFTSAPSQSTHVLPTPAKTPARKHAEQNEKSVNAIARNLFSKPQSPKKMRTKQYKFDSFDEAEDDTFQIYTDSQDRLPAPDVTEDNPFYGEAGIAASAKPVRRSSRNRKNIVGANASEQVDEVVKRKDGMLYVFRGKKIFRKFSESEEASSRLDVKPRLLFPSAKSHKENDLAHTDEEADTDIEQPVPSKAENVKANDAKVRAATPVEASEAKVDTPKAPKYAPASPPDTSRATRSKKITSEPVPIKTKRAGNRSPFDGWRRTKTASEGSVNGQKRPGEPISGPSASKRPRTEI